MKLSGEPEVFDEISFPRPSNPVVTAGSPTLVSELALFGTRISASSILGVFYGFAILVVVLCFVGLFILSCFYEIGSYGSRGARWCHRNHGGYCSSRGSYPVCSAIVGRCGVYFFPCLCSCVGW